MRKALALVFLIALIGFTTLYTGAQSGRFSWITVGGREAVTLTGVYRASVVTDLAGVATITCQEDAPTIAVAGAAVGDVVIVTPRAAFSVDTALATCRVSAADVVSCSLCNSSITNPLNPDEVTLDVLVIRFAAHR